MTKAERLKNIQETYAAFIQHYPFSLTDLTGEVWRDICGYNGKYQESNYGRTKSFCQGRVMILKPKIKDDGYLFVNLFKDGKQKNFYVHRLVALCFIPNPLGKPQVNHKDGIKFNCHVSNLEWVTHKENMSHAATTSLMENSEMRFNAKLTNEQVMYIRDNPEKLNCEQLAEKFGINGSKISAIQIGKIYRSVGGTLRETLCSRTADELREKICAEYIYGSSEFGSTALAKKYGVSHRTILNIIHDK